jgi:hypothetical protein
MPPREVAGNGRKPVPLTGKPMPLNLKPVPFNLKLVPLLGRTR